MDVNKLAGSHDPYTKEVFSLIKGGCKKSNIAGDSSTPVYQLTQSDIDELQHITFRQVQANYLNAGMRFQTLSEARDEVLLKIAGDTLYNDRTNVGTLVDPSVYTHSNIPVMMGMVDETNLYASGGLPATIIDKKSRAMILAGLSFKPTIESETWNIDKVTRLEAAAAETGLNNVLSDAITDAFIYGGSICYPQFKGESPTSFVTPIEKLNLEKGCIDRWINVDRWNITTVPSFQVTQRDYLNPKFMYIPQAAVEISTSRMAILRPRPMPYWAALYNIGWSPSDFTGWMRSYFGYEISMQSVPVMAQQMSLLLYRMPLDALNATIGTKEVEKLMAINEQKMSEWSAVNPKAVNMIGDVEVVNRTYSGFDHFVGAMKSDLAAQSMLPEPSLWHTPNKGFSDNTQESLLKQSESLQMLQKFIERSLNNIRDILICHVFGIGSEEWENRGTLLPLLNKPTVSTEREMAETGARFAASISSFVQAGVSPDVAIQLSKSFFPSVVITDDMIAQAKESYERRMIAQANDLGGQSNQGPKTQAPNLGWGAKAQ